MHGIKAINEGLLLASASPGIVAGREVVGPGGDGGELGLSTGVSVVVGTGSGATLLTPPPGGRGKGGGSEEGEIVKTDGDGPRGGLDTAGD